VLREAQGRWPAFVASERCLHLVAARVRCPSARNTRAVRVEGLHQPHQSAALNAMRQSATRQMKRRRDSCRRLKRRSTWRPWLLAPNGTRISIRALTLRPHPVAGRAWPQRVAIPASGRCALFAWTGPSQRKPLFGALDRSAPRSRRLYMTAEFWQAVSRSTTARSPRFRFRRNVWFCIVSHAMSSDTALRSPAQLRPNPDSSGEMP